MPVNPKHVVQPRRHSIPDAGPAPPPADAAAVLTWEENYVNTLHELRKIYQKRIQPLEERYLLEQFRPSWFADVLVPHKPLVLFLGPFSAGKTTFINFLLGGSYLWTGPEPTTNKFTVVMHGKEVNPLAGPILAASKDLPFNGLSAFGSEFLENLHGLQVPAEISRFVTFVDTPGVLETSTDIHSRQYSYLGGVKWFAQRADLIFVMFDPTKLDSGRELAGMFECLRGCESKVRIVLNKADSIDPQSLMRVYGSLFWNLSSLIRSSEPPRVYVGSFWDRPYKPGTNIELFDKEREDLFYDLCEAVPLQALDKKISAVMRRCTDVIIHAGVVGTLKEKMPSIFGKDKSKNKWLAKLGDIFEEVALRFRVPLADFPDEDEYRQFFDRFDLFEFSRLSSTEKDGYFASVRTAMEIELPRLLKPIQQAAAEDPRKRKAVGAVQHVLQTVRQSAARNPSTSDGDASVPSRASMLATMPSASSVRRSPPGSRQNSRPSTPVSHGQYETVAAGRSPPAGLGDAQVGQPVSAPSSTAPNVNMSPEQMAAMMAQLQSMMAQQQGSSFDSAEKRK